MPVFFQHIIDEDTRLGIWKIEEPEEFFLEKVPLQRNVTHPHKRLQHLAGRFLLQFLVPGFPNELIKIADTRKPYLPDEAYHFSISHCGDYAAAIVSKNKRVGIDIEIPTSRIVRIQNKFLNKSEFENLLQSQSTNQPINQSTLFWSCKEAVYKWYGNGGVEFREHIQLSNKKEEPETIDCFFTKTSDELIIHYKFFDNVVLAWTAPGP